MKLVASVPCYNELNRYLPYVIESLQRFCDEIRVLDDGSTDGSQDFLRDAERVEMKPNNIGPSWASHEGYFRQTLLDWTMEADPDYILAVDADELIIEGDVIREHLNGNRTYRLRMVEVWDVISEPWTIRVDGGWRPHPVGILYRPEPRMEIPKQAMACGRVPDQIRADDLEKLAVDIPVDVLHLGWAEPRERQERHQRYVDLDGGKFHAGEHLDSILWPNEKCALVAYDREAVLA